MLIQVFKSQSPSAPMKELEFEPIEIDAVAGDVLNIGGNLLIVCSFGIRSISQEDFKKYLAIDQYRRFEWLLAREVAEDHDGVPVVPFP